MRLFIARQGGSFVLNSVRPSCRHFASLKLQLQHQNKLATTTLTGSHLGEGHLTLPIVAPPCACGRNLHTSTSLSKKTNEARSTEPIKFTTSKANTRTLPETVNKNPYQPLSVVLSLFAFMVYFLYLREENDLDEELNVHLFDRVPAAEEAHLIQAIPRMRQMGIDTAEAEARLKEVIRERKAKKSE